MGKYSPLGDYLRAQKKTEVPMTFAQIERIVGTKLPRSHRYRAWWSNNADNSVMTRAWLDAGYRSEQVDIDRRKLVFKKVDLAAGVAPPHGRKRAAVSSKHPLFGCMKGTFTIAPGIDLAQPAMPEWGEVAYGNKTWDDFK